MAKIISHHDIVLRRIGTNSQEAMDAAAEFLVEAVQDKILYGYHDWHGRKPHTEIVESGDLFDSIRASVKRDSQNAYTATIGTDRTYASYVHDGTRYEDGSTKLKGRPFIRDAFFDSLDQIKEILGDNISQGFR